MSTKSNPYFMIYSLEKCPYCERAEQLVTRNNLRHKVQHILQKDKYEWKERLGASTFPQIYYHDGDGRRFFIGGCSDFEDLLRRNLPIVK